MWDLPGPGITPMSPALAGGLLSHQGSPKTVFPRICSFHLGYLICCHTIIHSILLLFLFISIRAAVVVFSNFLSINLAKNLSILLIFFR